MAMTMMSSTFVTKSRGPRCAAFLICNDVFDPDKTRGMIIVTVNPDGVTPCKFRQTYIE